MHIIKPEDFDGYVNRVQLACDTARGKVLHISERIRLTDPMLSPQGQKMVIDSRFEVSDRRLPEGKQLVMITWDFAEAINKYNELG